MDFFLIRRVDFEVLGVANPPPPGRNRGSRILTGKGLKATWCDTAQGFAMAAWSALAQCVVGSRQWQRHPGSRRPASQSLSVLAPDSTRALWSPGRRSPATYRTGRVRPVILRGQNHCYFKRRSRQIWFDCTSGYGWKRRQQHGEDVEGEWARRKVQCRFYIQWK